MGKKSIITLSAITVILIAAVWIFSSIYIAARDQYEDDYENTKQLVIEKGYLTNIDQIETFYGQIKYHVLSGENAKQEKLYVWVPKEKGEKVIIKKQSSGITVEDAIAKVKQEYNQVNILDVELGIDEEIPIWEITYIDKSERHTFDYVNFYDGEIIKHMAIKKEESN